MGRGLRGCVAPQSRNPTPGTPIRAQAAPRPDFVRPQPTPQTVRKGRLKFRYAATLLGETAGAAIRKAGPALAPGDRFEAN